MKIQFYNFNNYPKAQRQKRDSFVSESRMSAPIYFGSQMAHEVNQETINVVKEVLKILLPRESKNLPSFEQRVVEFEKISNDVVKMLKENLPLLKESSYPCRPQLQARFDRNRIYASKEGEKINFSLEMYNRLKLQEFAIDLLSGNFELLSTTGLTRPLERIALGNVKTGKVNLISLTQYNDSFKTKVFDTKIKQYV